MLINRNHPRPRTLGSNLLPLHPYLPLTTLLLQHFLPKFSLSTRYLNPRQMLVTIGGRIFVCSFVSVDLAAGTVDLEQYGGLSLPNQ